MGSKNARGGQGWDHLVLRTLTLAPRLFLEGCSVKKKNKTGFSGPS